MSNRKYSFPTAAQLKFTPFKPLTYGLDVAAGIDVTAVNVTDEQVKRVIAESRTAQSIEQQREQAYSNLDVFANQILGNLDDDWKSQMSNKDFGQWQQLWGKKQEAAEKESQDKSQAISLEKLEAMYAHIMADKSLQVALDNLANQGIDISHLRVNENDFTATVFCNKCMTQIGYAKSSSGYNPKEVAATIALKRANCCAQAVKKDAVEVTVQPLRPKRVMEL